MSRPLFNGVRILRLQILRNPNPYYSNAVPMIGVSLMQDKAIGTDMTTHRYDWRAVIM